MLLNDVWDNIILREANHQTTVSLFFMTIVLFQHVYLHQLFNFTLTPIIPIILTPIIWNYLEFLSVTRAKPEKRPSLVFLPAPHHQ